MSPRFCEIAAGQPARIPEEEIGNSGSNRGWIVQVARVLAVELEQTELSVISGEVHVLVVAEHHQAGFDAVSLVLPQDVVLVLKRIRGEILDDLRIADSTRTS